MRQINNYEYYRSSPFVIARLAWHSVGSYRAKMPLALLLEYRFG